MRQNNTKRIALGGMLAAVAIVIMCLGGLIPIATYLCPLLCCITAYLVLCYCGKRIAWTWFVVVSILSLLLAPDKEAALVFGVLGYYPFIKESLEHFRLSFVVKMLYFNGSVMICYSVLMKLIGMSQLAEETLEFGLLGLALILIMGNTTFFLLDRLLNLMAKRLK